MEGKRFFIDNLLDWYEGNARQLPWRETRDPYYIWVSEVMLQQTQVKIVIPYYLRFIKRYSTLNHLAESSLEEVLILWSGLGYYKRAKQLKASAQIVKQQFNSNLPKSYQNLVSLPGIGNYIASAILSIAFGFNYPALDGNVKRLLARYYSLKAPISKSSSTKTLLNIAQYLSQDQYPKTFNQALIEFGALVCKPKPLCNSCIIQKNCLAYSQKLTHLIPHIPKKKQKKYSQISLLISLNQYILISKRKPSSHQKLLPLMWELPSSLYPSPSPPNTQTHIQHIQHILQSLHFPIQPTPQFLFSIPHSISFRSILCSVYSTSIHSIPNPSTNPTHSHLKWIKPHQIHQFPHSSLVSKILSKITKHQLPINSISIE